MLLLNFISRVSLHFIINYWKPITKTLLQHYPFLHCAWNKSYVPPLSWGQPIPLFKNRHYRTVLPRDMDHGSPKSHLTLFELYNPDTHYNALSTIQAVIQTLQGIVHCLIWSLIHTHTHTQSRVSSNCMHEHRIPCAFVLNESDSSIRHIIIVLSLSLAQFLGHADGSNQ